MDPSACFIEAEITNSPYVNKITQTGTHTLGIDGREYQRGSLFDWEVIGMIDGQTSSSFNLVSDSQLTLTFDDEIVDFDVDTFSLEFKKEECPECTKNAWIF